MPLARTATPSHQHLCFPLYRPITSPLSRRGASPVHPRCVSQPFHPASIRSPMLSHPTILPCSRRVHEKKNGEKRPWLGMESLATHPRLIPLFSRKSSVAPRSESTSARRTRSECGWIKLELQRMIGQSLTRLRLFSRLVRWFARSLACAGSTRVRRRYDKYRGTSAHF